MTDSRVLVAVREHPRDEGAAAGQLRAGFASETHGVTTAPDTGAYAIECLREAPTHTPGQRRAPETREAAR
ncbi:hypothetical protein [Streptomyces longwoodensis]|uniref:hypothetical protein n=1 Tax=Streptomyces longwoodensis TaxID=68231 RepID=UPI003828EFED